MDRLFGIAAYSSTEGDPVELSTTGVSQLPKASIAALTVGAGVSWDDTAKQANSPATGRLLPIGVAAEATGNRVNQRGRGLDGVATAA